MSRLTKQEIRRLRDWGEEHNGSEPYQLANAMGTKDERGFRWRVLRNALEGAEIRLANLHYIRQWMAQHCPAAASTLPAVDGKSAAAGEREE